MKYGYTIIYVEDVKKTLEFYQKAFGFEQKFITPENDYGELITGNTTLAFGSKELGESNFAHGYIPSDSSEKPLGVELAFVTENIAIDFNRAIEMGATELVPISEKPWGQKVGYLKDINGFLIEICTPINEQ